MTIAIIGAGKVGTTLGRRWAATGNQVLYGVRHPPAGDARQPDAADPTTVPIPVAVAAAETVVLTVPWAAVPDALASCGDLHGKLLIDCTNPIGPGFTATSTGANSGAELVASLAPGARVVKAFNTLGTGMLGDLADLTPTLPNPVATFICGDDDPAKTTVSTLGAQLGFEVIDAGPLAAAVMVEALALLWINLAYKQGLGPDFAFGLVRRP